MIDVRFVRSYSQGDTPGLLEWDMLGGVYTSVELDGLSGDVPVDLTGVWVVEASPRNMRGGRLGDIFVNGSDLAWRAPGSAVIGPYVTVPSDYNGDETSHLRLEDGEDLNKYVKVIVRHDILPVAAGQNYPILLHSATNVIFDDVTAIEATEGVFDYRCFFLKNVGDTDITEARIWFEHNVPETVVNNTEGYPIVGPFYVYVDSTEGYPPKGIIKNITRNHRMVYTKKSDTWFYVPGGSPGGGMKTDVIGYDVPVDLGTEGYPASTIPAEDQAPLGVNLFHPTEAEPLELVVDIDTQVATIWIRRNIWAGFPQTNQLHFDMVAEAL